MLRDGAWPDGLVLGIGDPEDCYCPTKLRYKAFPQGIPGNLPLIVSSNPVIVERNASEVGTISESVQTNVNRNVEVSEPALSVLDVASRGAFSSRDPVESLGGVTDAPVARATRAIAIGEGPISVQDAILINLKKNVAVSETVLFSDSVATQTTRVKAVAEPSLTVSDAISNSVRRSVALFEPDISVSELVAYAIERSIAASELILASDAVSTSVYRNVEVLESTNFSDSIEYGLVRSVIIAEVNILVNDVVTALNLPAKDTKSIDILEDLGSISDSVLTERFKAEQQFISSLLAYFDSHAIVGLTRDRRIIAKANYKQTVGTGWISLMVRVPDLKYIEEIIHVQFDATPIVHLWGPFNKSITGNLVGLTVYTDTGTVLDTEVIAVGPP